MREEQLWPDGVPGAAGRGPRHAPRLYYFPPNPARRTRTAVVVAGGGSYGHQGGLRVEAIPTARWLADNGITAIVVRYRVGRWNDYDHEDFLADGARAVQRVREQADALQIDTNRIGFIGFSAGGHLSASLATRCGSAAPPIEVPGGHQTSCRPDFAAAIYPVVTLDAPIAHERSVENLLGSGGSRDELAAVLSVERLVTPTTAPMFLVHSGQDAKVDPRNSDLLFEALKTNGVEVEYLRPEDGGHGVGLAQAGNMPGMARWPDAFLAWMEHIGALPASDS